MFTLEYSEFIKYIYNHQHFNHDVMLRFLMHQIHVNALVMSNQAEIPKLPFAHTLHAHACTRRHACAGMQEYAQLHSACNKYIIVTKCVYLNNTANLDFHKRNTIF